MKTQPKNPKVDVLKQFVSGEISSQDLTAYQLGINIGDGIHLKIKGFEHLGCLNPVQIDEVVGPNGQEILAPCPGAYFYEGRGITLVVGVQPYDSATMAEFPRKPSLYASLSVFEGGELGSRGCSDFNEEEHERRLYQLIQKRRAELQTLNNS